MLPQPGRQISIHALREEGDYLLDLLSRMTNEFLSTPSARRATCAGYVVIGNTITISIHALREEGDDSSYCGYWSKD